MITRRLTGVFHIHTVFSHDGHVDLPSLRKTCRASGMSFACITDHAEGMSPDDVTAMVRECALVSDAEFTAVPGLEFAVDDAKHILAVGLREMPAYSSLESLLCAARRLGALTVLAHPKIGKINFRREALSLLDGVEVWNSRYDGRFVPNPTALSLFRDMAARKPDILAFSGNDAHYPDQVKRVTTHVYGCDSLSDIIQALAAGRFDSGGGIWRIGSSPRASGRALAALRLSHAVYTFSRGLRSRWPGQRPATTPF